MAAGILACLAACNKEQNAGNDPAQGGRQYAYIVNEETRTDFDSYVGKFAWTDGDRIAIHLSDGTFYETAVDPETGAFACSTTPTKKRDAYAIYPAAVRDASNYGSPTLNVVLPAEYDITDNLAPDFSPVPMIAVNRQAEDDLYFRHVGGLLRITCDRIPAGTKSIAVTASRNIAGTFTVTNPASENPTISTGGNSPTVTFLISDTPLAEQTSGIILNVPVPVGPLPTLKLAALDASGAELFAITRNVDVNIPRYHGKKFAFSLTEVFSDSMDLVVTAGDATAWEFTLPFLPTDTLPADLRIIWGDGTITEAPAGATAESAAGFLKHTYTAAGDYTITVEARTGTADGDMIPNLRFYPSDATLFQNSRKMLKSLPTHLLKMTGEGKGIFEYCDHLESVCRDLLSHNGHFTSARLMFAYSGIQAIPAGLFDPCPEITDFAGVFFYCKALTAPIPDGLFDYNTKVTTFLQAFTQATSLTGGIPAGLFHHCPEATDFRGVFNHCESLTGPIPKGLFDYNTKAESFNSLFQICPMLGGSIPEGLFDHNPKAQDFTSSFNRCQSLTGTIPPDLFAHCPEVTSFNGTFNSCDNLTGSIPAGMFDHNEKVKNFSRVFCGCNRLTGDIPAGLFDHCPEATDFSWAFHDCNDLDGCIPPGLFDNNPEVTDFSYTFSQCYALTGGIPAGLFDHNEEVTTFERTFAHCHSMTGPIPQGLFDHNTKVTTFYAVFGEMNSLQGSIPAGLFDHCPDAVNFAYAFINDKVLGGTVPAGLFSKNLKAYNFYSAFSGCNALSLSPDIFIDAETTAANRFANCAAKVDFRDCFKSTAGGTAPSLWNYTFPKGVTSSGCFASCSALTNGGDIPSGWK